MLLCPFLPETEPSCCKVGGRRFTMKPRWWDRCHSLSINCPHRLAFNSCLLPGSGTLWATGSGDLRHIIPGPSSYSSSPGVNSPLYYTVQLLHVLLKHMGLNGHETISKNKAFLLKFLSGSHGGASEPPKAGLLSSWRPLIPTAYHNHPPRFSSPWLNPKRHRFL